MKRTITSLSLLLAGYCANAQVNAFYVNAGYLNSIYNQADQTTIQTRFSPVNGFSLSGGYAIGLNKRISILVDLNYTMRGSAYEISFITGVNPGPPPLFTAIESAATHTIHTLGLHSSLRLNLLNKDNHKVFLSAGLKPNFIFADKHKEDATSERDISELIKSYQETVLMDVPIKLGYTLNSRYELNLGYNIPLLNVHRFLADTKNLYTEIGFTYYFLRAAANGE